MPSSAPGARRAVHRRPLRRVWWGLTTVGAALTVAVVTAGHRPHSGPVTQISRGCSGQNAEAEQAVDGRYVYVAWIGCGGIGFARSVNGSRSFGKPVTVPGSAGHGFHRSGIGT